MFWKVMMLPVSNFSLLITLLRLVIKQIL